MDSAIDAHSLAMQETILKPAPIPVSSNNDNKQEKGK